MIWGTSVSPYTKTEQMFQENSELDCAWGTLLVLADAPTPGFENVVLQFEASTRQ